MRRMQDWSPLAGADPIPGDPLRVRALAARIGGSARNMRTQVTRLEAITADDFWEGEAASAFVDRRADLVRNLGVLATRYERTAAALHAYHPRLAEAQRASLAALRRAREAEAEAARAERGQRQREEFERHARQGDTWSGPDWDVSRSRADDELAEARAQLERAVELRDTAADTAARAIDDAIDDDIANRGGIFGAVGEAFSDSGGTVVDIGGFGGRVVAGLAESLYTGVVTTADLIAHPDKLVQLARFAIEHPDQFASAMLDLQGLQEDPARWLGGLAAGFGTFGAGRVLAGTARFAKVAGKLDDGGRVARSRGALNDASQRGRARRHGATQRAATGASGGQCPAPVRPHAVVENRVVGQLEGSTVNVATLGTYGLLRNADRYANGAPHAMNRRLAELRAIDNKLDIRIRKAEARGDEARADELFADRERLRDDPGAFEALRRRARLTDRDVRIEQAKGAAAVGMVAVSPGTTPPGLDRALEAAEKAQQCEAQQSTAMTPLTATTVLSLPLAADETSGAEVPLLAVPIAEGTGVLAFRDEALLAGHVRRGQSIGVVRLRCDELAIVWQPTWWLLVDPGGDAQVLDPGQVSALAG